MTRTELQTMAEQEMKKPGYVGEAWLYVYEITSDNSKTQAWVKTMLNRAMNDQNVSVIRKRIYEEVYDALD